MNQQEPTNQEIKQAEHEFAAANLELEFEVFDRLLHLDYQFIQPGGVIEGQTETLASLKSDDRKWIIV